MKRLEFKQKFVPAGDDYEECTHYFVVMNKKDESLGIINKEHWGRWCWEPESGIVMSRGCLKEIVEFMEMTLGGKP